METQMGYQLSSITPHLDTPEHIQESFAKIAAIGYRHVQLQGVPIDIDDDFLAHSLQAAGLHCVATQEDYPLGFGENPERRIARAVRCGAQYLSFALIPRTVDSVAALEVFAQQVNRIAQKVQAAGLVFAFHPIGPDFRPMDGQPVYQRLMNLLPSATQLNLCVSGAHSAGVDPLSVLAQYAGRVDLVHFKDDAPISDTQRHLMPLGQGSHDWAPILSACRQAGVQYVLAEQERWLKDAFACAQDSYDYLKGLGM